MPASELIRLVEALGAPYGLERSVKIAPGALYDDRCLISVHRTAFGRDPAVRLREISGEMALPAAFAERLAADLDDADIVHFGHEATPDGELRKIYFEYASQARQAIDSRSGKPVLVHIAYKWAPARPSGAALTRYTWLPCPTRRDLEARLRDLVPPDRAPCALHAALTLIDRARPLAESGGMMMMAVDETGSRRRSADLNVYDAELRLSDVADLITQTASDFAVPGGRLAMVFDDAWGVTLGHLSAGLGRDGEEFVTIYYGVEAH